MRVRVCYSILFENKLLKALDLSTSQKQIPFCLEDKILSKAALQIALTRRLRRVSRRNRSSKTSEKNAANVEGLAEK